MNLKRTPFFKINTSRRKFVKLRRTPYLKTGNCEQLLHKRFARATVAGPLWVKDPPRYLFMVLVEDSITEEISLGQREN